MRSAIGTAEFAAARDEVGGDANASHTIFGWISGVWVVREEKPQSTPGQRTARARDTTIGAEGFAPRATGRGGCTQSVYEIAANCTHTRAAVPTPLRQFEPLTADPGRALISITSFVGSASAGRVATQNCQLM